MSADKVLLIGNGISRLSYDREIREFKGQRWGANRIYLDYGEILDVLAGHTDVMHDAKKYREENNLEYRIIGGHIEKEKISDISYTCPKRFLRDSGTSLLSEALHRGNIVYAVGYDMGGPDIYSRRHQGFDKSTWINRWREIIQYYGSRNIHFIGHDHLPFLLSRKPAHEYSRLYMMNKNHISGEQYEKAMEKWREMGPIENLKMMKLVNISRHVFLNIAQTGIDLYPDKGLELPEGLAIWWAERYPWDLRAETIKES